MPLPLNTQSIRVASVYGRLCCLHLQPTAQPTADAAMAGPGAAANGPSPSAATAKCSLYALSREAVTLTREFSLYGPGPYIMQTVDELLLVHQPTAFCTMFFDAKVQYALSW